MSHSFELSRELNSMRSSVDYSLSHSYDRTRSVNTGSRSRSWSRRSRLLLLSILILVLVNFFTALLLGTQVYSLSRENQKLRANLARTEGDLRQTMPELERLRVDLDNLVRGKLPRLRKLQYDKVLALDEAYLKNIIFTEIINRDHRGHEYKLVVQNNTPAPLWPEIQLLVFNEVGIQIGAAEVGKNHLDALKSSLDVGEVRSYSSVIQLADKNAIPAYFMIRIPEQVKRVTESIQDEGRGDE